MRKLVINFDESNDKILDVTFFDENEKIISPSYNEEYQDLIDDLNHSGKITNFSIWKHGDLEAKDDIEQEE